MDFRLDDQQLALQESVAGFCTARYPLDDLAQRETADAAARRQAWDDLIGLGVFSILLPEAAGGLGLGLAHAALVFEQLGAHLVPGPLVWTALAADPEWAPGRPVSGLEARPRPTIPSWWPTPARSRGW